MAANRAAKRMIRLPTNSRRMASHLGREGGREGGMERRKKKGKEGGQNRWEEKGRKEWVGKYYFCILAKNQKKKLMVDETGLDEPKVDETAVNEIAVDKPGLHREFITCSMLHCKM